MDKIFTFDPIEHVYTLDGRKLPSVTEIIGACFEKRPWWNDYYANRGTALHLAIKYLSEDDLDLNSVDDTIKGRLRGFELFIDGANLHSHIEASEISLYSKKYRFAGTIDQIRAKQIPSKSQLVDFKSSYDPIAQIQLGGYSLLYSEAFYKKPMAYIVALNKNGTYKIHEEKKLRKFETMFLNCLSIYSFKKQYNVK